MRLLYLLCIIYLVYNAVHTKVANRKSWSHSSLYEMNMPSYYRNEPASTFSCFLSLEHHSLGLIFFYCISLELWNSQYLMGRIFDYYFSTSCGKLTKLRCCENAVLIRHM